MQLNTLILGLVLVLVVMSLGWLIQRVRNDAGIVDVLWTFAVGALGILYSILGDTLNERRLILAIMVGVWSLRLGLYILFDRVIAKPEDGRYKYLRDHWGKNAHLHFFWFFQAQGLAAFFFSIPFYFISTNSSGLISVTEYLGVICWLIAIFGEWLSDSQLRSFRSNPNNKGKTCQSGLWKYSRHPNYFFEWLHWWSYVLMLVDANGFYLSLLCPAVMLYTLFKVTGIPHTEAQALRTRGEEYRRYQKTTSIFIPWFPRGNMPESKIC